MTTARIALRPLEPADAASVRAILASPEVATWWGPVPEGFPATDAPEATRLVILDGDSVRGMVQYGEEPDADYRHAWIDIFVDPAVHGRGIGTEALRAIVAHLVRDRGHHRITIDPAADNAVAIRCYEKAGFRPVGVMEAAWRDPSTGVWRDMLLMELVRRPG